MVSKSNPVPGTCRDFNESGSGPKLSFYDESFFTILIMVFVVSPKSPAIPDKVYPYSRLAVMSALF